MNLHRKLLERAVEALVRVLEFEQPADSVLSAFFREHRQLGQNDRSFIAESVFGVLRHKRVLAQLTGDLDARRLFVGWLARFSGASVREIAPALAGGEAEWASQLKRVPLEGLPLAIRAELPDWVWDRLIADRPPADVLELGHALQNPAPLDLRVNTLRIDRPSALRTLADSGVESRATPFSPVGLRVTGKPAINRHPLFLDGSIEVQDEGSQLIGYLVAPRRHELVVDFCAGAGGKSLMLGALMQNHGRIYAFDVSSTRLARLKPRLKRSGLSNLHPQLLRNEHDVKVRRLAGKIDRVLVDAPCSGLGTLRRNPDLKWRQSPESVERLRQKQASIVSAAAGMVKSGGRLVYATCSLLREENEDVVEAFLETHRDFVALDCGALLTRQDIRVETGERLRLWPHVHGTDGFFAAVFERIGAAFPAA